MQGNITNGYDKGKKRLQNLMEITTEKGDFLAITCMLQSSKGAFV